MFAGVFEVPGALLSWLYSLTHSYGLSISAIAVLVMLLVTPLILKSTKGMLEMQKLAPEMRKLQQEHKSDRQQLNQEMMKLYQEHKVNPMASCLPMLAQMPVFFIMFQILNGMTYRPTGGDGVVARAVLASAGTPVTGDLGFYPRYLSRSSELYQSLVNQQTMTTWGLDLSLSPAAMLGEDFGRGLIYVALVVALGALYFAQQRMVAARAAVSPTMSVGQQKLMQYLPVVFAVFQIFFLLALVIYYMVQTVLRILQQAYITRRFYGHEESLGRQAQQASERARDLAKADGGGGPLAQAKRDLAKARDDAKSGKKAPASTNGGKTTAPTPPVSTSKRTTAPKNRPTAPATKQVASRPGNRPTSAKKRNRP
ncbi:MAG TPA: YidC/Oxa1 family membrane protein insertase [Ilumatobacter sp.]|nr:YidC/Oxa1 family membrane protein insertase [Ilumatobacter sp.]